MAEASFRICAVSETVGRVQWFLLFIVWLPKLTINIPINSLNFFFAIIRPHGSTTYVDVAYCYRRVMWSVCWSVTVVIPAKIAELNEMPFGLRTQVGPRNHVLDGSLLLLMGSDSFEGGGLAIVKYRETLLSTVQKWLNGPR